MRTRITHHERSICEFIADPVHHAAHTLAIVAIGSHGHLRFDALLYPAEGNVVKAAGQYDLQVCALLAPDLRPAVGKLNAAARIRIAQGKAAVGKGHWLISRTSARITAPSTVFSASCITGSTSLIGPTATIAARIIKKMERRVMAIVQSQQAQSAPGLC